ncbi:MAG: Gfo/Idh/MocA family oxidoreductase [Rhodothermales bacterium]
MSKYTSRRDFLRLAATSPAALAALPAGARTYDLFREPSRVRYGPNDMIRVATIGMGGMGYGDTRTALMVDGVEFVAAADAYDGRLAHAKEAFGKDVFTTRDYREILRRSDVDAVIIATPDHWHQRITIDALEAGKAVYCEKPMVQHIDEGPAVLQAAKKTGKLMTVGSQHASSLIYEKARDLYRAGSIGKLNMVEARINRNSAMGAWQYTVPPDASPETVDWDGFIGHAPKRPFDPIRFFRWRNYYDYGTGIPGDLFVHLFTGIHLVLNSNGPTRIMSTGGLRYWLDGRDAPDVMLGLYDYPETDSHPAFTVALSVNFADGGGGDGTSFRFIGNEGVITITGSSTILSRLAPNPEPGLSIGTFTDAIQEQARTEYREKYPEPERPELRSTTEEVYRAPGSYDSRYDHFNNFFTALREGGKVLEDPAYGYRAAAPALLTNTSYIEKRTVDWDPLAMKVVPSM